MVKAMVWERSSNSNLGGVSNGIAAMGRGEVDGRRVIG
jgi:hypothetical protein